MLDTTKRLAIAWTEAEDNALKRMLAEGRSLRDIGAALGRTRCMVGGRVHRLKLSYPGRGGINAQTAAVKSRDVAIARMFEDGKQLDEIAACFGLTRRTVQRSLTRSKVLKLRPRVASAVKRSSTVPHGFYINRIDFTVIDAPTGPVVLFSDLSRDSCRWPIGEPGEEGFGFCGCKSADGLPYCVHHAGIAYLPRNYRKQRGDKP